MKYVVIGGDRRFECLERILAARGERVARLPGNVSEAQIAGAVEDADLVLVNHPSGGIGLEDLLKRAHRSARIFTCGPQSPALSDPRLIDLWQDEELKRENAYFTAEGAVAAAMQNAGRALREMRCLVVGFGRIGKCLTELLVGMGAAVTVASRGIGGRHRAIERGARAVSTDHLRLRGFDVVFSTPPARVIDDKILKKAERDVMILDLASPPYGVDLKAAWDLGLRAWREPALPGRYCPESAAMAILRSIERNM